VLVVASVIYDRPWALRHWVLVLTIGKPAIVFVQGWHRVTVHNPGALPAAQFFEEAFAQDGTQLSPDLTVVFEDSYATWSAQSSKLADATKVYDRTKLAVVLHSVPDLSIVDTEATLLELLSVGRNVWLTGDSNYTKFDAHFPVLMSCLAMVLSWSLTEIVVSQIQKITVNTPL
jgi:hypothetical protein